MIALSKVVTNAEDEVYFLTIKADEDEAIEFLSEMWKSVNSHYPEGQDALGEWTDRGRCVRSLYRYGEITIYTHAWDKSGDERGLDKDVLSFLGDRGLYI